MAKLTKDTKRRIVVSLTSEEAGAEVIEALETAASGGNLVESVNGKIGEVVITKTDVGLSNVENTSDANKPVSTATQNALNLKADQADLAALETEVDTKATQTYVDSEIADAVQESKDYTGAAIASLPATQLPAGGTTGQVLAKASNADQDVEWVDQSGSPTGDYLKLDGSSAMDGNIDLADNDLINIDRLRGNYIVESVTVTSGADDAPNYRYVFNFYNNLNDFNLSTVRINGVSYDYDTFYTTMVPDEYEIVVLDCSVDILDVVNFELVSSNSEKIRFYGEVMDFNGTRLTEVAEPVDPDDAATKAYVDAQSGGGNYLPLDGSEAMVGDLDMGNNTITRVSTIAATNSSLIVQSVQDMYLEASDDLFLSSEDLVDVTSKRYSLSVEMEVAQALKRENLEYEPTTTDNNNMSERQFFIAPQLDHSSSQTIAENIVVVAQTANNHGTVVVERTAFEHNNGQNTSLNQLTFKEMSMSIGNGTDPNIVNNISYINMWGGINNFGELDGSLTGINFSPNISTDANIHNSFINSYVDNTSFSATGGIRGMASFSSQVNINEVPSGHGFNAFRASHNIGALTGGYGSSFDTSPNIGTMSSNSGYNGLNVNLNIAENKGYVAGINVNMDNVTNFPGVQATLSLQGMDYEVNEPGTSGNNITVEYTNTTAAGSEVASLAGQAITVSMESGVTTLQQIYDALSANFTISSNINFTMTGNPSDVQVSESPTNFTGGENPGSKQAANFKGDVRIEGRLDFTGALSIGALNAFASQELTTGTGNPASIHLLITQPTVPDNTSISSADLLGINTAMLLTIGENSTVTSDFLGVTALGLPAVASLQSGSTIDRVAGGTFAISMDASSTGGTIDNLELCRTLGIPNGITTVNRLVGYKMDLPFGPIATNQWGVYIDPSIPNYFKGSVVIGDTDVPSNASVALEVTGSSKAVRFSNMSTAQRDSLSPLSGMVVFNTDSSKLQVYNGTSWDDLH